MPVQTTAIPACSACLIWEQGKRLACRKLKGTSSSVMLPIYITTLILRTMYTSKSIFGAIYPMCQKYIPADDLCYQPM